MAENDLSIDNIKLALEDVVLADGTIVTSTYGKFSPDEKLKDGTLRTYIASKRIKLNDIDELVKKYFGE